MKKKDIFAALGKVEFFTKMKKESFDKVNYDFKRIYLRRNCIEIAPRALLLAATVVLTVVLISVMVVQFKSAQEMMNVSSELMSDRTEELRNGEILELDGLTVKGSDVVNVCKRELGKGIKITLKNDTSSKTYTDETDLVKLRDYESNEYIKPFTDWKCRVVKNKNGIITDIIFSRIDK